LPYLSRQALSVEDIPRAIDAGYVNPDICVVAKRGLDHFRLLEMSGFVDKKDCRPTRAAYVRSRFARD